MRKIEVAAGHEGGRQAVAAHLDRHVAGQRRVGDGGERVERTTWSSPRRSAQSGLSAARLSRIGGAHRKLDGVALAVVEADRFDRAKRSSAQARQTVESCPPENSTRAVSGLIVMRP